MNCTLLVPKRQHCDPTCLLFDIQSDFETFIHELNNLDKIIFLELSGSQSWST